jgi:hypothetical protein
LGWRVWRGPVPPELVTFAVAIRDKVRSYKLGTIAETKTWRGQTVAAFCSSHTWTYRNGMLVTGICIPGVSLLSPTDPNADKLDPGLSHPDPDAATWTAPGFDWVAAGLFVAAGALGCMWWRSRR